MCIRDRKKEINTSNTRDEQAEDIADGKTMNESAPAGNVSSYAKEEGPPASTAAKAFDKDEGYYANQMSPELMAQRVSGRIISQNGDPLIGVNLLVQGTNLGTTSQLDGKFELYLPHGDTPVDVVYGGCLLYTSDAADERSSVDLGG